MPGTTPELKRLAIEIVAANQPCSPNYFKRALKREGGASERAANETLLTMIRDGELRRTWNGKLVLP